MLEYESAIQQPRLKFESKHIATTLETGYRQVTCNCSAPEEMSPNDAILHLSFGTNEFKINS